MEREAHTKKFLLGSILMNHNNGMLQQSFLTLKQCMEAVNPTDMVNSTHKTDAEHHILQYLRKIEARCQVQSIDFRAGAAGGGRSQAGAGGREQGMVWDMRK